MRKVLFKKWIDGILATNEEARDESKSHYLYGQYWLIGTKCYSDYIHEGVFHSWSDTSQTTVAIVEHEGILCRVEPECLRFVDEKAEVFAKKVEMFYRMKDFEKCVNRIDIEVLSIDIKAVEQSSNFQEGFCGIVFYKLIQTK